MAHIKDLNVDRVKISREISRQRASRFGRVGSGRLIILYDSASPKMVIKMYLHFFDFFLKVLELFECRRGDPYITANGNFVRFAHLQLQTLLNYLNFSYFH